MIYIAGYALTNILIYLASNTKKLKGSLTIAKVLFSLMPLFFISSLRYGIGTDYHNYVLIFDLYASNGIQGIIEPFFYAIMRGISLFELDIQWVFVISSAIFIFCTFNQIFEESPNVYMSIFLFFFFTFYLSSFNIVRQCVAISICFYSIRYITNKCLKKFLLLNLIAFGFHYSSIIFLIAYPLRYFIIRPSTALVLNGIVLLLSEYIVSIFQIILKDTKYFIYFDTLHNEIAISSIIGIIIQLSILGFSSIYYSRNKKFQLYYNLQVIATILTVICYTMPWVHRIKIYFSLPSIILIPIVLHNMSYNNKILSIHVVSIMTIIYYFIVIHVMGAYDVIPYNSILCI